MSNIEIDVRREAREILLIKVKTLRSRLQRTPDPVAAREIDGLLRDAESRLASLTEKEATHLPRGARS